VPCASWLRWARSIPDGKGGIRHEPLTRAEGDAIWKACEDARQKRAEQTPDEQAALRQMHEAYTRLKELGWSEASYCPKDGSTFNVIKAGSTGIFRCYYEGEWPKGSWWVQDEGDLWPSRPILFKLDPNKEAERQARLAEAGRDSASCSASVMAGDRRASLVGALAIQRPANHLACSDTKPLGLGGNRLKLFVRNGQR
jgi:hypothetical protein